MALLAGINSTHSPAKEKGSCSSCSEGKVNGNLGCVVGVSCGAYCFALVKGHIFFIVSHATLRYTQFMQNRAVVESVSIWPEIKLG